MVSTKTGFRSDTDIIFQKQERIGIVKIHYVIISASEQRIMQWFSNFFRCDVFGTVCWTYDAPEIRCL